MQSATAPMLLLNSWPGVLSEDWQNGGFGLYVHWPFCTSKCPYCDFNSHVAQDIDHTDWAQGYLNALSHYASEIPGRKLDAIYFGGGTPSLMQASTVQAVIDQAQRYWHFSNNIEITLEANPSSVEAARLQEFRQAGVNRVSLGIQALNNTDLRLLGRMHSAKEAVQALDIARQTFERISFDLIYARQNQSLASWESELTQAMGFAPDHLSLYQLTVEPETVFGARHRAGKLKGLPDEDLSADMYFLTQNICNNNMLPLYEVSNHSKKGAASRHNMIYWNAGDYVGIGPGAHGRLTLPNSRYATETPLSPQLWLRSVLAGQSGESRRILLSGKEQALEYLIMGLRTTKGVSQKRLEAMGGDRLNATKITDLTDLGMLKFENGNLRATSSGLPVLNAILRDIAPD